MGKKILSILKFLIFISIIVCAIFFIIYRMDKYEKEGETNMPFSIKKMLIVSTVDGKKNDNPDNIWDITLKENNDVYLYILKDENSDEKLKEVAIENFEVSKTPQKGNIKIYRPTGDLDKLYTESTQDYLNDKLIYNAGVIDDPKTLTINKEEGILCFRISLEDLGNYVSNDDTEIAYNGTLLSKVGTNFDELKFEISFDIVIKVNSGVSYRTNYTVSLPGEKLMQDGNDKLEITDFSDIVFKRDKK